MVLLTLLEFPARSAFTTGVRSARCCHCRLLIEFPTVSPVDVAAAASPAAIDLAYTPPRVLFQATAATVPAGSPISRRYEKLKLLTVYSTP